MLTSKLFLRVCVCVLMWTSCQSDTPSPIEGSESSSGDPELTERSITDSPCDDAGDCQRKPWVEDTERNVVLQDFPNCTFIVEYRERDCQNGYGFEILGFGVVGSCPEWIDSLTLYSSQGDAPLANFMLRMQRRIAMYYAPQIAAQFSGQLPPFPGFVQVGTFVVGECLSYYVTGLDPSPELGAPTPFGIPPYVSLIYCGELCCEIGIAAADREGKIFTRVTFPTKVMSEDICQPESSPLIPPVCADDNGKGYLTQCLQHCSAL